MNTTRQTSSITPAIVMGGSSPNGATQVVSMGGPGRSLLAMLGEALREARDSQNKQQNSQAQAEQNAAKIEGGYVETAADGTQTRVAGLIEQQSNATVSAAESNANAQKKEAIGSAITGGLSFATTAGSIGMEVNSGLKNKGLNDEIKLLDNDNESMSGNRQVDPDHVLTAQDKAMFNGVAEELPKFARGETVSEEARKIALTDKDLVEQRMAANDKKIKDLRSEVKNNQRFSDNINQKVRTINDGIISPLSAGLSKLEATKDSTQAGANQATAEVNKTISDQNHAYGESQKQAAQASLQQALQMSEMLGQIGQSLGNLHG